jgi:hypothetical protein
MKQHLSISALARAIHPASSRHRAMAILKAYFDASFTDPIRRPRGVTAIGGYVGSEGSWLEVVKKWLANLEIWRLEEFSVSAITNGRTSVPTAQAVPCIESFGKIIRDSDLAGVSAAISDQDWAQTVSDISHPKNFAKRYRSCVYMLFSVLKQEADLEFPGDSVAVLMDRDVYEDEQLTALMDECRNGSEKLTIAFGAGSQHRMIEAADLCAGAERLSWLSGGPFVAQANKKIEWFHLSYAKRHRSAYWDHEQQRKVEEALSKRAEWKVQQAKMAN